MPLETVALLTNFLPPYRVPLCRVLGDRIDKFSVLVSTPMEADRPWNPEHEGIQVEIQKTLTFKKRSRHPHGFRDQVFVHVPYDTLSRLFRIGPDVIVSSELGARTAQALLFRLLHPSSRLIVWVAVSEHTERGRDRLRLFMRRRILPRADAVVVNGASGARYVEALGVPGQRVFVIPQTIDTRQFSSVSLERSPEEAHRLLYVGRLIELKGLSQFLSTLCLWCKDHPTNRIEFWLVGDGPIRGRLEKAALPQNLRLRFWGNVAYGDLPNTYARAGILAFPTLADTWGLVVNEAMAAGLPVLGSLYSQAVEDIVEDGRTGWTFHPDRPTEVYRALERALGAPPEELRRMGAAARQRAEALTPELAADLFMEAFGFVLGRRGSLD